MQIVIFFSVFIIGAYGRRWWKMFGLEKDWKMGRDELDWTSKNLKGKVF